MAGVYEIYTYGGGEALSTLFNGIVGIVGDNSYNTLVKLAGAVGLAWVMLIVAFKPDNFSHVGKWFVSYVVIFNALLVPKIDIAVVDRLNPGLQQNIIQNVPWGLGYFAHMASHIGDGTTRLMEKDFSLPNDLKYQKYGTVMASSLVARASEFKITDPDLASNIRAFMQQCVFYDILLGKYTIKELFQTNDIWTFVKTRSSPARSFRYNTQIKTCQEGANSLENDWKQEEQRAAKIYGKRFFPNQTNPKNALLSALHTSYQYLTNISEGAGELLRQNMMMNALNEGIINNGAITDATAAIQNFAVSRAEQQQRTAYAITGELASRWLPIMKNVFEALFYGAFPFVFLIVLLPTGIGILKTYLMSLFWIQSWAPLYAILNLLMHIDAKANSMAAASLGTSQGLNLATASGIAQINSDTAILAGYLSMAIPFIAFGIIKGGAYTFTHLAGYIGGVSQQSATQASEEATTGNISMANTSISNHNFDNMSAHKQDLNADVRAGTFSHQTESGATITSTTGGTQSISSGPAISSTGTQVHLAESVKASSLQQSEHYTQMAETSAQEMTSSLSSAYRNVYELSKHQSQHTASGEHYSTGESGQIGQEFSNVRQLVDDFAKNHALTTEQASTILGAVSANAGLPKAWREYISPVGVEASGQLQGMSNARKAEVFNAAENYVEQHGLSEKFDRLTRASVDQNYTTGTEQGDRIVDNIAASLDKADHFRDSTAQNLTTDESFREQAAIAEEKSHSINANATQEYVDWLSEQKLPGSSTAMGIDEAERILHNQPELARQYASQFVSERTQSVLSNFAQEKGLTNADQITSSWEASKQSHEAQFTEQYQNDVQSIKGSASHVLNSAPDDSVKQNSIQAINQVNEKIEISGDALKQVANERQSATENNIQSKEDHLVEEAWNNTTDAVKERAGQLKHWVTDDKDNR